MVEMQLAIPTATGLRGSKLAVLSWCCQLEHIGGRLASKKVLFGATIVFFWGCRTLACCVSVMFFWWPDRNLILASVGSDEQWDTAKPKKVRT